MALTVGEASLYTTSNYTSSNSTKTSKEYPNSVLAEGLNAENAKTEEQQKTELEQKKLAKKQAALIEKYKDKYEIKKGTNYSYSLGKNVEVYYIKAKKDVNLTELCKNLQTDMNTVAGCNGYGKYDGPNGGYVGNKQMKGVTIHVPTNAFGAQKSLMEFIKSLF